MVLFSIYSFLYLISFNTPSSMQLAMRKPDIENIENIERRMLMDLLLLSIGALVVFW